MLLSDPTSRSTIRLFLSSTITTTSFALVIVVLCWSSLMVVGSNGQCCGDEEATAANTKLTHLLSVIQNAIKSHTFQDNLSAMLLVQDEEHRKHQPLNLHNIAVPHKDTNNSSSSSGGNVKSSAVPEGHSNSSTFHLTLANPPYSLNQQQQLQNGSNSIQKFIKQFTTEITKQSLPAKYALQAAKDKQIHSSLVHALFNLALPDIIEYNNRIWENQRSAMKFVPFTFSYRLYWYSRKFEKVHPEADLYSHIASNEIVCFPLNDDYVDEFKEFINRKVAKDCISNISPNLYKFYNALMILRCDKESCPVVKVSFDEFINWCKDNSPISGLFDNDNSCSSKNSSSPSTCISASTYQITLAIPSDSSLALPLSFLKVINYLSMDWTKLSQIKDTFNEIYRQAESVSFSIDELRTQIATNSTNTNGQSFIDICKNDLIDNLDSILFHHESEVITDYINFVFLLESKNILKKAFQMEEGEVKEKERKQQTNDWVSLVKKQIVKTIFMKENLKLLPVERNEELKEEEEIKEEEGSSNTSDDTNNESKSEIVIYNIKKENDIDKQSVDSFFKSENSHFSASAKSYLLILACCITTILITISFICLIIFRDYQKYLARQERIELITI